MTTTAKASVTSEPSQPRPRVRIRRIQSTIVILALIVTGYMTYIKLVGVPLQCVETGVINCSVVENSAWARVMGIPTAMLGFIAHLIILAILVLETRVKFFKDNGVLLLFGVTLFSIIYHSYLIYVSVFILKAICPWCITAASLMLLQLICSSIRLRRYFMS